MLVKYVRNYSVINYEIASYKYNIISYIFIKYFKIIVYCTPTHNVYHLGIINIVMFLFLPHEFNRICVL